MVSQWFRPNHNARAGRRRDRRALLAAPGRDHAHEVVGAPPARVRCPFAIAPLRHRAPSPSRPSAIAPVQQACHIRSCSWASSGCTRPPRPPGSTCALYNASHAFNATMGANNRPTSTGTGNCTAGYEQQLPHYRVRITAERGTVYPSPVMSAGGIGARRGPILTYILAIVTIS